MKVTPKVGMKVYYDSLRGLLPCKVVDFWLAASNLSASKNVQMFEVEITEDCSCWKKGAKLSAYCIKVIPPAFVKRRKDSFPTILWHVWDFPKDTKVML